MSLRNERVRWPLLLGFALVAGAAVATVDNIAFEGEVSPIAILALLLASTAVVGGIGGARGSAAALAVWAWVPLAHLVKHAFGLPDTLQPNTYVSILMLAAFTLGVTAVGTACGVLARSLATGTRRDGTAHPQ